MKVSIIIPVYNEFANLPQVLDRVIHAPLPDGCEREIIVVDDGSTDGTSRLLDNYRDVGVVVAHHSVLNFGKGTAVRVGLAIATGEIILIQDGDLEYDPRDYASILEPLVSGKADVVYGSRFLGSPLGMKWANWLANHILTATSNVLFDAGITDEATAYKAFRADVIRKVQLECRRFEFCPEVTAKLRRAGVAIREVPISYNARGIAEGKKIRWQDGVHAMWTLLKYKFAPADSFLTGGPLPRDAHASLAARATLFLAALAAAFIYLRSDAGRLLPVTSAILSLYSTVALIAANWFQDNALLARYAVQSYGIALLVILCDLMGGLAILRLLPNSQSRLPRFARAAAGLALGAGVSACVVMCLGFARAITSPAVAASTICFGLLGFAVLYRRGALSWAFSFLRPRPLRRPSAAAVVLGLLFLPILLVHSMDLMTPVLEYDSCTYHMPTARHYVESHSLAYHDGLRVNAQPHLPVLSYARYWLLLGEDGLLKLANLEFVLVLLLAAIGAGRELKVKHWWLAPLLLALSPNLWWTAKIEYADMALVAYSAAAALLLHRTLRTRSGDWPYAAGAILGFAASSKYLGLAFAACLLGAYAVVALLTERSRWRLIASRAAMAGGLIALVSAPWWFRSWQNTGAPLHPFFAPSAKEEARLHLGQEYGRGQQLSELPLMGYRIATDLPFGYGDPVPFGMPFLTMQMVGAGFLVFHRRRPQAPALFLLTAVAFYYLFWFWTGQIQRYFLPALPLLGMLFLASLRAAGYERRVPIAVASVFAVVGVQAAMLPSVTRRLGTPPPVTVTDRETYLKMALPFYGAIDAINHEPEPAKVYLLFSQPARYYLRPTAYGDWFSSFSYAWLSAGNPDAATLVNRLRESGFRYLLIDGRNDAVRSARAVFPAAFGNAKTGDYSLPGTTRLFSDGEFSVLRINP